MPTCGYCGAIIFLTCKDCEKKGIWGSKYRRDFPGTKSSSYCDEQEEENSELRGEIGELKDEIGELKDEIKQQKIIDDVSDADRDDDWDDDSGDTHCGKCDGTGIWSSGGNIECPYCNGSGTATE